jgi:hypothetical protein
MTDILKETVTACPSQAPVFTSVVTLADFGYPD